MIEQGTPEWFAQRVGKVTASRGRDVVARTKSGPSASRTNYKAELVTERLTGLPVEQYQSAAMKHGNEQQPAAQAAYEFMTDRIVEPIGFVEHPRIPMCGASPDGLVGADGLIEIKCPNTATHIETLLGGKIDHGYIVQMQLQMACTGRQWCDFVSFDPRLPPSMQIHITRVNRDATFIEDLEREIATFLEEVADTVARLCRMYETKAAA